MTASLSIFGFPPATVADHRLFAAALHARTTPLDPEQLHFFVDAYGETNGGVGDLLTQIEEGYLAARSMGDDARMAAEKKRLEELVEAASGSVWPTVLKEYETYQISRFGDPAVVLRALRESLNGGGSNGHFDLVHLTPNGVRQMNTAQQYRLSLQVFAELERISLEAIGEVKRIDKKNLKPLAQELAAEISRLVALLDYAQGRTDTLGHLTIALKSSALQMAYGISTALQSMAEGRKTTRGLEKYLHPKQSLLVGGHGVRYKYGEAEIALSVIDYYLRAHHPIQERWEEGKWVLRFAVNGVGSTAPNQANPFLSSPWPPNPSGDIVLKTFLSILSWAITVNEEGNAVVFRVDFGQHAF